MILNKIKDKTTWSDASNTLNENFARILKGIRDGIPTTETPVDEQMSDESENAVQNKVIKKYVDDEIVTLEGYAEEVVNDLENNIKTNPSEYVKLKTINGKSLYGSGNIVIAGGEGGSGLQYAIERTVYLTRVEDEGDASEEEISDEEREYNKETYKLTYDGEPTVVLVLGYLLQAAMWDPRRAVFNTVLHMDYDFYEAKQGLYSLSVTITPDGDAVGTIKEIQTGGGSATPSDMNSDFSNDF